MSLFSETILKSKYADGDETWEDIVDRVVNNVVADKLDKEDKELIREKMYTKKLIPAGRYLYAAGKRMHQICNCLCLDVEDSREGWADLSRKALMALQTGAGIGVEYSKLRCEGSVIKGTGGTASGPISLMKIMNEIGRNVMQGGSRRSAILAQLVWNHPDIIKFIEAKNWTEEIRDLKARDFNFPAPLDMTNISVRLDDDFFKAYGAGDSLAVAVYNKAIKRAMRTGEPGILINTGDTSKALYTNACSEYRSETPDTVCNLGSINMTRIVDLEDMQDTIRAGVALLMCGRLYTLFPYHEVKEASLKETNIGLGLLGLHDWLLSRDKRYGIDEDLQRYLELYRDYSETYAKEFSFKLSMQEPKYKRAIAPTGTVSIIAETTSGIEPLFCVAYKRRYLKHTTWNAQYVIDPVAKRLIESGINENVIEDAYSIDYERRIAFQAWIQEYVDMAISSTINLPAWGTEQNNESTVQDVCSIVMRYLPKLRGITFYPDGARNGQPLVPVKYSTALKYQDKIIEEQADICDITKGGSCSS